MNINTLLKGINCSCGRHHECNIEAVIIEKGAILKLEEICSGYGSILLVADENTFGAAGERCLAALTDRRISCLIFPSSPLLIPDERAIERVKASLEGIDLILGVGSGVIQDLCKCVSKYENIPYMVIATAPSMDGYASTGAAMILNGMKETVAAGLPRAIICDTDVLKAAPMDMIKAGYGDIVGKYSALCDWRLSNTVNGEYLCDFIYNTTERMIEQTLAVADKLLLRDENAVAILTEALIAVGIMMSFAGSSRPASGSEHHLSHFFEIVGIVRNEPYFPHGIDVAFSAVITSMLRERLLKTSFKDGCRLKSSTEHRKRIQDIYGSAANGCIALQERLGSYLIDRSAVYKENEKEIKRILKNTPSTYQIEKMLENIGLDTKDFYRFYGKEKIKKAVFFSKDLKDRYTVLWLYYDFFFAEISNNM